MKPTVDKVSITNDGAYDLYFAGLVNGRLADTHCDIEVGLFQNGVAAPRFIQTIHCGTAIPGAVLDINDSVVRAGIKMIGGNLMMTRIAFHQRAFRADYQMIFLTKVSDE